MLESAVSQDNHVGVLLLKVELHTHTNEDPADRIAHTTTELIDRAASLGYGGLAVTLHDRYFDPAPYAAAAAARGVTLLSGIERTIGGCHVLLINFPPAVAGVSSFEELAALKAGCNGLVVAPHPFFPVSSALRARLTLHHAIIDAVEVNAMYTRHIDFNGAAIRWARQHGKPLVGNTDLHLLKQMGTTYSLVDAAPDADAICDAIRAGRVEVRSTALSLVRAASTFAQMLLGGGIGRLARRFSR